MRGLKKAVITAAGLGTRLLPVTKELPKEMLPVFVMKDRKLILKPLLQALFEQLYDFGIREFCFVVGRGKRAIEDHFTPDWDFVTLLERRGKNDIADDLKRFYNEVESSTIIWVNQPRPRGFGHAVLMARAFVGSERFLACAGDTFIISRNNDFLRRLLRVHGKTNAYATILLQKVRDPRRYGVAEVEEKGDALRVIRVVEKPRKPPSDLAIMPFYIFEPEIMDILKNLKPGVGDEIQLTDGIQKLIEEDRPVYGILLREDELRLDIGAPDTYWEAIRLSYKYFLR